MGRVTVGHAVKVLYDLTCMDLGRKDCWGEVARAFGVSKSYVSKMPSRIGKHDEAKSWPKACSEGQFNKYATMRVKRLLAKGGPNARHDVSIGVAELIRSSLVSKDGLTENNVKLIDAIEANDGSKYADELLFEALFSVIYKEADENRQRLATLPAPAPSSPAPASSASAPQASPLSSDDLAEMLGGGGDDVPALPACMGMDGRVLLERLLPRTVYLAHREDLAALARGNAPQVAAAIALELVSDDGSLLTELVNRAGRLAANPSPALFGILEKVFGRLEDVASTQGERSVVSRDRELVDRFVDGDGAHALAALSMLVTLGARGTLLVLSSSCASPHSDRYLAN